MPERDTPTFNEPKQELAAINERLRELEGSLKEKEAQLKQKKSEHRQKDALEDDIVRTYKRIELEDKLAEEIDDINEQIGALIEERAKAQRKMFKK